MTEQQWLACDDPAPMLEFLRNSGKASDRKLRLFACACCRRVRHLLSDKYSRKALTIAERYADAEVSEEKLRFAWGDARRAAQVAHRKERDTAEASAMGAVSMLCDAIIGMVVMAPDVAARCEAFPVDQGRLQEAQRRQVLLLRDIVGNPFSFVAIDPACLVWNGGLVLRLAQAAYDEPTPNCTLDNVRLAVLSDALEDAGCTDRKILGHLRSGGEHWRGCHALDSVLGKS